MGPAVAMLICAEAVVTPSVITAAAASMIEPNLNIGSLSLWLMRFPALEGSNAT
jgi:hypothetical protein